MPTIAAIDAGSNALRLAVATTDQQGRLAVIDTAREAVRLGQDVFNGGAISEASVDQVIEAFQKFREIGQRHRVSLTRAVATSALREAHNRDMVIDAVLRRTGIELAVIGPEEEARLVHLAVSQSLDLRGAQALIVDIGGGSMEITRTDGVRIVSTECFLVGAVRLLQKLDQRKAGEQRFQKMVREYTATFGQRLEKLAAGAKIGLLVGIGGNIETLGDLRQQLLAKRDADILNIEELDLIIKRLAALDYSSRVKQLGLRPDRADVIVPAAIVLRTVMAKTNATKVVIPRVGLREGMLYDIISELYQEAPALHRDQAINAAQQLGLKYGFDEQHAATVSRYALQLFDATQELHGLDPQHRLLLEVSALLHDIGQFVNANGHHKHSCYLIASSPIIGLAQRDRELVANIARYHRKASPSIQHDNYRQLEPRDRVVVAKLAAILRLADGCDAEHTAVVSKIGIESTRQKLKLTLSGDGDLLLAKWAVIRKGNLFEEVYGAKIIIAD